MDGLQKTSQRVDQVVAVTHFTSENFEVKKGISHDEKKAREGGRDQIGGLRVNRVYWGDQRITAVRREGVHKLIGHRKGKEFSSRRGRFGRID